MSDLRIPGVTLDSELGRGAHSVVYRGRCDGEICAVKLPLTRARWTRWIYREAVALARVHHPLLPAVLEVGEVDGLPYLVMELVEGETLADQLARGALEEARVVEMAQDLASALGAVHAAGLVHRDVKPRNIVVTTGGSLKLVDFGFATPMERTGAADTAGTAAYAAPEQLVPPGRVDGRSDLFGLGRVLLECLVGADFASLRDRLTGVDVAPALVARGISQPLAAVVGDLLQREPSDRYPDAIALQTDLERLKMTASVLGARGYVHESGRDRAVGRESELAQIVERLSTGGSLVLLGGGRGYGKTTVVEAAEHTLRATKRTIAVTCERQGAPLSTLRRVFEGCAADLSATELVDLLGNLAPLAEIIAPGLIGSSTRPHFDPAHASDTPADALVEAAAEILLRLARRQPNGLVIFVDDVHWIDVASAQALLRLVYRLADSSLSLLLAGRPDGGPAISERFLTIKDPGVRVLEVQLVALREDAIGRIVGDYLGARFVDPLLTARVASMADGSPLGVREIVGALLDAGALRPHARRWQFDPSKMAAVVLPRGAVTLLGRRLAELPAAPRRVLEAAAILGLAFRESLVARVLDLPLETVGYAMVAGQRAGLLETIADDEYRFIHDSLRETLVDELPEAQRRQLHQRAGEVLSDGEPDFEQLCRAARHFAAGDLERDPARTARTAEAAARAALSHFDDEAALEFQSQAVDATTRAGQTVGFELHRIEGEALLRRGALERSITSFEAALEGATDPLTRATLLGRISWAHETQGEPDRAWEALSRAFVELGAELPVDDVASAMRTTTEVARGQLGRFAPVVLRARRSAEVTDLLCQLHYQNARLATEYGKIARVVQSSLATHALVPEIESLATRARAEILYSFVVGALGRKEAGLRGVRAGLALAKRSGDPGVAGFATQMLGMATAWSGRFEESIRHFGEAVEVYGPWSDIAEYCGCVTSVVMMLEVSGRPKQSWVWIQRALSRIRRSGTAPRMARCVIQNARAALSQIGESAVSGSWLADKLEEVRSTDGGHGFLRLQTWGSRALYFLHAGLGPDFDALVTEVEGEKINPKTAHMTMLPYYTAVAQARLHQYVRSAPSERAGALRRLEAATSDLRAAARLPVVEAHALAMEGAIAAFQRNGRKGTKLLAQAEEMATRENCPWVLYTVARVRAHVLRQEGKRDMARDHARVAETLAIEHGAVVRAQWIREELDMAERPGAVAVLPAPTGPRSTSSRTNRQLAALLLVAKSPRRDLRAEQQAVLILDELLHTLQAEHASVWFQPEVVSARTAVVRSRGSDASMSLAAESPRAGLLKAVHASGETWPSPMTLAEHPDFDAQRVMVVPLSLYEHHVGALMLERDKAGPPFAAEDRQLLELLAHQVPIALEIARLLYEREQLQASMQQAQKMEAIGQLAGGLAHDFNNMLAAMRVALSVAQERATEDAEMAAELDIIAQATTRASQLTTQLLSFSRNQPLPTSVQDINQLITSLEPMLRRVASPTVELSVKLSPIVDAVSIEPGGFDQALMNLLINARDAMPAGGKFTICTRNVTLSEASAQRLQLAPGRYIEIEATDTGEGIAPETIARIFEPFFTTKSAGRGTGLGLATVYGFAKSSGGGIDVQSEVGVGTTFRLYLKRVDRPRRLRAVRRDPSRSSPLPVAGALPDTILVIDDDDLVRRSIAKILERNGYRVVAAGGSAEAMDVARSQGKRIGLVIMDVLLPGVTGPELGRRLGDLDLPAKMLFVSGFSAESAPIEDAKVTPEMLLQKPFTQAALLERVRKLMPS